MGRSGAVSKLDDNNVSRFVKKIVYLGQFTDDIAVHPGVTD